MNKFSEKQVNVENFLGINFLYFLISKKSLLLSRKLYIITEYLVIGFC